MDFIGMNSYSEDVATYDEKDNLWKVTRKIVQSRSGDLINWISREFSVMSIDKSFDGAHETAFNSMIEKLRQVNFDLFSLKDDPEIKELTYKKEG
jgi:hypothetical protein